MSTPRPFKLSATAVLAATTLAALSSPASAVAILESHANLPGLAGAANAAFADNLISESFRDTINNGPGLIFSDNLNTAGSRDVGEVNGKLLGRTVDYLGRFNGDATSFDSDVAEIDDNALDVFDMIVTNGDGLISWSFDQSLATFGVDWNIIKVGLKYGGQGLGPVYFLIDPPTGSDSGSIDMADYNSLPGYDSTLHAGSIAVSLLGGDDIEDFFDLPQLYNFQDTRICTGQGQDRVCVDAISYNLSGLSHIDIYGTPNPQTDVPEPGVLGLLGLGLAGLGLIARRRRTA